MQRSHMRIVNNALSVVIFVLAVYILFAPFLPEITSTIARATDETGGYKYKSRLANADARRKNIAVKSLKPIPKENTLVVPGIEVDGRIWEGTSVDLLNKGIWHRPKSSTPDKGGNTVLVAHRFLYTSGPNTFYHLPKMKVGDKFFLFWEGKEYDYEVYEVKIVPPTAVEIEDNTQESIVTLYTCTPLWTAENRLVVRGKLIPADE